MPINKKLIHFNRKEKFEEELGKGNILPTSIVFIKDTQEIWTHGQYYSSLDKINELGISIEDLNKAVFKPSEYKSVDLGLPSGTLWCDRNVGASSPEDAGLYFAWGETQGYTADQLAEKAFTWDDYKFGNPIDGFNKYQGTGEGTLLQLEAEDDAATVNMGTKYHMPTEEQILELYANTDVKLVMPDDVEIDGTLNNEDYPYIEWDSEALSGYHTDTESGFLRIKGIRLYKKGDSSVSLFFPAAGYFDGGTANLAGVEGRVWQACRFYTEQYAKSLYFDSYAARFLSDLRSNGFPVRGVTKKNPNELNFYTKEETDSLLANLDEEIPVIPITFWYELDAVNANTNLFYYPRGFSIPLEYRDIILQCPKKILFKLEKDIYTRPDGTIGTLGRTVYGDYLLAYIPEADNLRHPQGPISKEELDNDPMISYAITTAEIYGNSTHQDHQHQYYILDQSRIKDGNGDSLKFGFYGDSYNTDWSYIYIWPNWLREAGDLVYPNNNEHDPTRNPYVGASGFIGWFKNGSWDCSIPTYGTFMRSQDSRNLALSVLQYLIDRDITYPRTPSDKGGLGLSRNNFTDEYRAKLDSALIKQDYSTDFLLANGDTKSPSEMLATSNSPGFIKGSDRDMLDGLYSNTKFDEVNNGDWITAFEIYGNSFSAILTGTHTWGTGEPVSFTINASGLFHPTVGEKKLDIVLLNNTTPTLNKARIISNGEKTYLQIQFTGQRTNRFQFQKVGYGIKCIPATIDNTIEGYNVYCEQYIDTIKVARNTIFPSFTQLIELGYIPEGTDQLDTETILKGICKWSATKCVDDRDVLQGTISPNSRGYCVMQVYGATGVNSEGLPKYCSGQYNDVHGNIMLFGTYNGQWRYSLNFNKFRKYNSITLSDTNISTDSIKSVDIDITTINDIPLNFIFEQEAEDGLIMKGLLSTELLLSQNTNLHLNSDGTFSEGSCNYIYQERYMVDDSVPSFHKGFTLQVLDQEGYDGAVVIDSSANLFKKFGNLYINLQSV